MFAGDQAALAVAGMSVAVVGRVAEDGHRATFLAPAHNAVVGDVAPQQKAPIAKPDRPFRPACACPDPFYGGAAQLVLVKARIQAFHRRVRIAHHVPFPITI